ncbi:MAG: nucleotide sugar dehydrogenase [Candidatus Altiarchaeota archaeon]
MMENIKKRVCVVGLGYVGMPLALLIQKKGHPIIGYEIDEKIVEGLNSGHLHINDPRLMKEYESLKDSFHATKDPKEALVGAEIIIICVPTPIDEKNNPDLNPLEEAVRTVSKHLKRETLVVIESTIYPGVTEHFIKPLLEESGLNAGTDFFLAHCPERIDPGNEKWTIANIPRVVGALTSEGLRRASSFYRSILEAEVYEARYVREAEAAKVVENTFRDINIAYVNELAKSFDKLGIDVVDVIKAASTKPFGFMAHYPGCGVGGHCIPVDPYYLIERAKQSGFDPKFLSLAREINNSMPDYTINLLVDALNQVKLPVKGTKIGLLGLAYKGNVDDIRQSPSLKLKEKLEEMGAEVKVFDPFIPKGSDVKGAEELLSSCEAIILASSHNQFKELDFSNAPKLKVVIDGRNFLDKKNLESLGILYKGIGR